MTPLRARIARLLLPLLALAATLAAAPHARAQAVDGVMRLGTREVPGGETTQLAGAWRFRAGDDPSWASPALDDRGWALAPACLCREHRRLPGGNALPSAGGPRTAWMRLRLRGEGALRDRPLALFVYSLHGAAEVYVDGALVFRAGDPGGSADQTVPRPVGARPLVLGDRDVVVAVRYSLASAEATAERFGRHGLGFQLTVARASGAEQYLVEPVKGDAANLMFFAGLTLAVGVLHLLLFLFFARPTGNLYFALYALVLALHIFCVWRWHLAPTADAWFGYARLVNLVTWPLASLTPVLFLYSFFYDGRIPWHFWLVATPRLVATVLYPIAPAASDAWDLAAVLIGASVVVGVVVAALVRRKEGAVIVGAGICSLIAPFVWDTLGEAGAIPASPVPYLEYFGIAGLCLAMSVYLARDYARSGKRLLGLSRELEAANRTLEQKVEARTAELGASEQKWRRLMETASDAIFLVGADDLRVRDVNRAAERLTGHAEEELLGREVVSLIPPEHAPAYLELFRRHVQERIAIQQDLSLVRADGSRVPVEVRGSLVDLGGERLVQAIVRDITERHAAQRALRDAAEAAEAANRTKSQFLANMSHELRTPLNAIVGFSEMLMEEAEDEGRDDLTGDLRKIRGAGRHLLGLINDILDISKIEAGKMELFLETFPLAAVVRDVVSTVEPLAAARRDGLAVRMDDDPGEMHADPVKVRQVLFNLLSNAVKFTEDGTVTLSVARQADGEGRPWVRISVADTGIGIGPDKLGQLFQPFTQADASVTRRYGGTGLGLTITRHFVEMMGGTVSVTSAPGEGTTFLVLLPAEVRLPGVPARPATDAPASVSPPEPTVSPAGAPGPSDGVSANADGDGGGPTVLLVDDDERARELIARTLRREGFRVVAAAGGEEGLRLARRRRPDVITLDLLMPGMDGWAVLAALKADPALADVPVVMLTILDEREAGYALGVADYLLKPVERDRLVAAVSRHRPAPAEGVVLLVEDEPASREMLRRTLQREGWEVREAGNGAEALASLAERRPHCIVLDLVMPEMDGFAFVEALRATPDGDGIPVVVVTSVDLTEEERARLRGSVENILRKGVHPREEVVAEVRRLLASPPARAGA
jgi:PAS domain S-box-containing protein